MGSISYVKVKRKEKVKLNIPCHVSSLATILLLWSILQNITVAILVSQEYALLLVIFHKRGRLFHQGFQTVFECLETLMKQETRVYKMASQEGLINNNKHKNRKTR